MQKDKLIKLGVPAEIAENIAAEIKKEFKNFVSLERFNEAREASENLKKQIAELKNQNAAAKKKFDTDMRQIQINSALKSALNAAKAKNSTIVAPLLKDFLETAEINSDGSIKGLDEEIKKLSESESTGFLFEKSENTPKFEGLSPQDTCSGVFESGKGVSFAQKYNSQFNLSKEV